MECTIRSYKDTDLNFIMERHRTMYAVEYGYKDNFYNYAKKSIVDFLDVTNWEREKIWIADADGKPIGVIALVNPEPENPWEGQIRWFLVSPEYRKSGVGSALMNKLLESAVSWEYKHLILWTASNLEKALAFYKRYGFYETQRLEEHNWCDHMIYEVKMERDVYCPFYTT